MESNEIILGDCIEEMKKLPENSVDAIVTDPPYGLGFMNKEWDNPNKERELIKREKKRGEQRFKEGKSPVKAGFTNMRPGMAIKGAKENRWFQEWSEEWSKEAIRVLKPGGYMLVCCATRMYHRMVCGIEDAGFEIRDTIMWLYGSGFPKSLNIGKQVDKIQGNEREVVGISSVTGARDNPSQVQEGRVSESSFTNKEKVVNYNTKGNSEWEGWGTALKPACEPIVVARKPLSEKNVALNVLKWGTGGINIDACRIGQKTRTNSKRDQSKDGDWGMNKLPTKIYNHGRFPANIILDEEAGRMLYEQSGHGVSRFFYCAKTSKSERNFGLDDMKEQRKAGAEFRPNHMEKALEGKDGNPYGRWGMIKNNHPTVKPIKLMEYLIKLVSREGSTVLDPFLGSGTTAIACIKLNRKFIGIEKEEEYIKIARARIRPFIYQTRLKWKEKHLKRLLS
ncbi:MAG: site-specific DNA-methyltransferase [Bacteroidetes bacterium]|nr:site-specific DNA-methyltransferase [Bacteroidota bacterium]